MIRTIVCQRDGCNGNAFYINSHDGEMSVVCKECNSEYKYETENNSLLMLSTCSNCNNDTFRYLKILKAIIYMQNVLFVVIHQKIFLLMLMGIRYLMNLKF